MYINYEVARIFKRVLTKFDKSFRYAFADGGYLYATDGRMAIVYRCNPPEWDSRPEGTEGTLVVNFSDMVKSGAYARVDVSTVEEANPYMWWTADQLFERAVNKEKIREAVKAGMPAVGYRFDWEGLAVFSKPKEWACFAYPLFKDELPGMLIVGKRMDILIIVTPFTRGNESDAVDTINRIIGE